MRPSIVWFRSDLRLSDNPALVAARDRGSPVIPVFIDSPEEEAPWSAGQASRAWQARSLAALASSLRALGSRLVLRRGPAADVIRTLLRECNADAVFWNRRYEPAVVKRDAELKSWLRSEGIQATSYPSALLTEPRVLRSKSGQPFRVFTPFWNACLQELNPQSPLNAPRGIPGPDRWPSSLTLTEIAGLQSAQDALMSDWTPGEDGARKRLASFTSHHLEHYAVMRDVPAENSTSMLSPHLHFGEISPRQIWHAVRAQHDAWGESGNGWRGHAFIRELGWREFSHNLLFHFPHTAEEPLRHEFRRLPWRVDEDHLNAWKFGRTGFPLVDAGMRQLLATGWMHNRMRMVTASFLVKDLLINWLDGARWFWERLVDADLAQNTLGWQWSAGCGADAAPFFRIFNPHTQARKFDPHGEYVRRWCPELARLPGQWIHRPQAAPPEVLAAAGVALGSNYPFEIVDHSRARQAALEAFATVRR